MCQTNPIFSPPEPEREKERQQPKNGCICAIEKILGGDRKKPQPEENMYDSDQELNANEDNGT